MNRRIAFKKKKKKLLWEGHHRPPWPLSLFSFQLGINLLMQRVLQLLVEGDQQMQNGINAFGSTWSQSTHRSRWMYLFVVFMYFMVVPLPSNYRDHTFVSPFLVHLRVLLRWTDAICPCSPLHRLYGSVNSEKRWEFPDYCSQTITVWSCADGVVKKKGSPLARVTHCNDWLINAPSPRLWLQ